MGDKRGTISRIADAAAALQDASPRDSVALATSVASRVTRQGRAALQSGTASEALRAAAANAVSKAACAAKAAEEAHRALEEAARIPGFKVVHDPAASGSEKAVFRAVLQWSDKAAQGFFTAIDLFYKDSIRPRSSSGWSFIKNKPGSGLTICVEKEDDFGMARLRVEAVQNNLFKGLFQVVPGSWTTVVSMRDFPSYFLGPSDARISCTVLVPAMPTSSSYSNNNGDVLRVQLHANIAIICPDQEDDASLVGHGQNDGKISMSMINRAKMFPVTTNDMLFIPRNFPFTFHPALEDIYYLVFFLYSPNGESSEYECAPLKQINNTL